MPSMDTSSTSRSSWTRSDVAGDGADSERLDSAGSERSVLGVCCWAMGCSPARSAVPVGDGHINGTPCRKEGMMATGRRRSTSRAELERVALGLFATKGFDETTVDDIAAAAGIGRRTFFRYH